MCVKQIKSQLLHVPFLIQNLHIHVISNRQIYEIKMNINIEKRSDRLYHNDIHTRINTNH